MIEKKPEKYQDTHPGTEDTVEYVDESHAHMQCTGNKNDRGTRYLGKDLKQPRKMDI